MALVTLLGLMEVLERIYDWTWFLWPLVLLAIRTEGALILLPLLYL